MLLLLRYLLILKPLCSFSSVTSSSHSLYAPPPPVSSSLYSRYAPLTPFPTHPRAFMFLLQRLLLIRYLLILQPLCSSSSYVTSSSYSLYAHPAPLFPHPTARLSKSNFFCATNISVWKFCANKMGQKKNKFVAKWPKKGKTVVNCAFLRSKTQILRNIWTILRDRTVAPFRNSDWKYCLYCAKVMLFCQELTFVVIEALFWVK